MSTNTQPNSSGSSSYNKKQEILLEYLNEKIDDGQVYFKSRFIADDLDLSPNEVGKNMMMIAEECDDLNIQKWSRTSATTWKVEKD